MTSARAAMRLYQLRWLSTTTNSWNYFNVGTAMIPHPSKVAKGGEDALSVSKNKRLVSVADGVGGWAESGVDPAEYSRALCSIIKQQYDSDTMNKFKNQPRDLLISAVEENKKLGSCTCVILEIDDQDNSVNTVNLGDSGYLWVRKEGLDGVLKYET